MNKIWVTAVLAALLGWLYLAPIGTGFSRLVGITSGAAGSVLGARPPCRWPWWAGCWLLGASGYPWYRAFLYPLTIVAIMGICVRSAVQFWRGEARWKDRVLPGIGAEVALVPEGESVEHRG